jgi:hypothetical protein
MSLQLLQVTQTIDEIAAQRYGKDIERSVDSTAARMLAAEIIRTASVKRTVMDPSADDAPDYLKYGMKRVFRYSVAVERDGDAVKALEAQIAAARLEGYRMAAADIAQQATRITDAPASYAISLTLEGTAQRMRAVTADQLEERAIRSQAETAQ